MRIAITGASGYIGSRLVRAALDAGFEVDALVRPASSTERIAPAANLIVLPESAQDLAERFKKWPPDLVVHLATQPLLNPGLASLDELLAANVGFGAHLLEAMAVAGCQRLVNAGSFAQFDSEGTYRPNSLYAATKQAMQDFITYYAEKRGLKAITLIVYDVYGPGDWRGKFLSTVIRNALRGQEMPATAGQQRIDLVHVSDAVRGFLQAIDLLLNPDCEADHRVYRLDSGRRFSLQQVVDIVAQRSGCKPNIIWGALPYPDSLIMEPINAGPRLPGWEAEVPLEQGLDALITELGE